VTLAHPAIRRLLFVLVAVAAMALAYFAGYRQEHRAQERTASETKTQAPPTTVQYQPGSSQLMYIQSTPVLSFPEPLIEPLSARVAYDENYTSRVSSPVAGRVVKIAANPGDAVRAGDTLAWLDAPEYLSAIADVGKSNADLVQKQKAFERSQTLLNAEVIARKDFETTQADLAQARAENERARKRLLNLTREQRGLVNDRYGVRAPISGVVAERKVNPGSEVRPDAPDPLFVITDPTHVWVIIDLPEKYLGKIEVGQKVTLDVDAYPGADFWGEVASVGRVLDPATRRVPVRCTVSNSLGRLKPEMFARVTPIGAESRKLPRIPNSALFSQGLYSFVFVEKGPGTFERRQVTLGLQGRDESYVKEGLADGERVVTGGALLLNSELAVGR